MILSNPICHVIIQNIDTLPKYGQKTLDVRRSTWPLILERIKMALDKELWEEQAGFWTGRSCTDQIATLRIIVEQSIEWQSPLYINVIDFEKTFGSVSREV